MRNHLYFLPLLFICFLASGQNDSDENKYSGFEIYFLKEYKGGESSYRDFNKKEQRQFKKEFKKTDQISDSICHWYIDLEKSRIEEKPFLNQSDIEFYSPSTYKIKLTESGINKMLKLKADVLPVNGKPYIIVGNGKKLIGAWFWSRYSSYACDRIYSLIDNEVNEIELTFRYCGSDPRSRKEFLDELKKIN